MASDMVVALGPATVGGVTLVGVNLHGPGTARPTLRRYPGRHCSPDETVQLTDVRLPQARQIYTVLGSQPPGEWGFRHGFNEQHVFVGCGAWQSKLGEAEGPVGGLHGPDLVRLALERARSAQNAVDILSELIARHGQGAVGAGARTDHVFLIADSACAFLMEAAGRHWALQEIGQARAVCDAALIRQDWQRLSPGLAQHVISEGLWPDDGSKLDFAGRLSALTLDQPFALKRWGRATLLLEQQNGRLEAAVLRRLLTEHFEDTVVRRWSNLPQPVPQLQGTLIVQLAATSDQVSIAWLGLGAGNELYFPVLLEGTLPPLLEGNGPTGLLSRHPAWLSEEERRQRGDELPRLQTRLDQEAEACQGDLVALRRQGNHVVAARVATAFMQAQAELLDQPIIVATPAPHYWSRQSDAAFVTE